LPNAVTTPSAPNAPQWLTAEKTNGRGIVIRGNAFREFMRGVAKEISTELLGETTEIEVLRDENERLKSENERLKTEIRTLIGGGNGD